MGESGHARGSHAEKEGEERWGCGWAALLCLLSPSRQAVPPAPSPSHPIGVPGGAGGAGATEYTEMGLREHVLLPRPCLPPSLSPRTAETVNTKFADAPWQDPLGTPQTGGDCSPTQVSKRYEQSVMLVFMPCDKNLSWSSQFPCFCALLKLSELPAMSDLDSHRLTGGKYSLTLAVG